MKPTKTTWSLTARDRRLIKEIFQAELKPLRDEVRRLRKENKGKLDIQLKELNRMVNG